MSMEREDAMETAGTKVWDGTDKRASQPPGVGFRPNSKRQMPFLGRERRGRGASPSRLFPRKPLCQPSASATVVLDFDRVLSWLAINGLVLGHSCCSVLSVTCVKTPGHYPELTTSRLFTLSRFS